MSADGLNRSMPKTGGNADPGKRSQSAIAQRDRGLRSAGPGFIIVGPPRTGTTWLHEVLSDHARLPSPTKETRFFDLHFHRGMDWYLSHFPQEDGGRPYGEVAPTYFGSADARYRIAETLPHAKLVFIFRHPVQRLVSLYRMKRAYGRIAWSLDEALERDPEMIHSSLYATNLRKWQSLFPKEQISINLYEDLSETPQEFVNHLTTFLEIPRFQLREAQLKQVYSSTKMTEPRNYFATWAGTAMADWCKARKLDNIVSNVRNSQLIRVFLGGGAPFSEVPRETLKKIWEVVLPEVEGLEELLGRDLYHWKPSDVS